MPMAVVWDVEREVALRNAVTDGDVVRVKNLISTDVDVNSTDLLSRTSLHLASAWSSCDVVQTLVENNADINAVDIDNQTPLHIATSWDRKDVIDILLKQENIQVNIGDNSGWTALHHAVKDGNGTVAKQLLGHKADKNCTTTEGWTILHILSNYGHFELLQHMLSLEPEHDASVGSKKASTICNTLKIADNKGRTLFHLASSEGHTEVVKLLLFYKADTQIVDHKGQTPLHHAAAGGHVGVIANLLSHNPETETTDRQGQTPLHIAAKNGQITAVLQLLEYHANIEALDQDHRTSLHLAMLEGQLRVMRVLLKKKANPSAVDSGGNTCLDIARKMKAEEIIDMLESSVSNVSDFLKISEPAMILQEDLSYQYFNSQYTRETDIAPLNQLRKTHGIGTIKQKGEAKTVGNRISTLIESLMGKFVEKGASFHELSFKNYFLAGSTAEGSKTSAPDEFDYVVVFKMNKSAPTVQYKKHGYAEMIYPFLGCTEFHTWFWKEISEVLQDHGFVKSHTGKLCLIANVDHGHQDGKACSTFKLRWRGVRYVDLLISVDLVPIIEIQMDSKFLAGPVPVDRYFMVPKPPHRESPFGKSMDVDQWDRHWRLSFVDTENQIVSKLPQSLRDVYITCKCVRSLVPNLLIPAAEKNLPGQSHSLKLHRETLSTDKFVSSYMLKVVCLREMESFKKTTMSLNDMVLRVFSKLVGHLKAGKLCNYWEFQDGADDLMLSSKRSPNECLLVAKLLNTIATELVKNETKLCKILEEHGFCTWNELDVKYDYVNGNA